MKRYGCVYLHRNLANGKCYIGQTIQDPERRWRKTDPTYHPYKSCTVFLPALKKYTWLGFESIILAWADDLETLNKIETQYIKEYNAMAPTGYNSVEIGIGQGPLSEQTKERISEKRKIYITSMGGSLGPAHNRKLHITVNDVASKECSRCSTIKPLTEYNKYLARWDGLHNLCKTCHNKVSKLQQDKHPENLNQEQWKQSYVDRKEKMAAGVKNNSRAAAQSRGRPFGGYMWETLKKKS